MAVRQTSPHPATSHNRTGSFISTGDEASVFARFSFRRHFFQHAGFRLVRSSQPTPVRLVDLTLV